MITLFYWW